VLKWYYETLANEKGRPMPQTDIETLENLPIKYDKSKEAVIFELVDRIMNATTTAADSSRFQQQIDNIIYGIYALTSEEISIVEGK